MKHKKMTNINQQNKDKSVQSTKLNDIECWQINLHRCKAASYNVCEILKNISSGLVLIQETWTYGSSIKEKLRGWNLFQGNKK